DVDQTAPIDMAREPGICGNDQQKQQGLTGRGVAFYLGAFARQNQRFADRLDDVGGRQQQEDVQRQQERGAAFSALDLGEEIQESIEQAWAPGISSFSHAHRSTAAIRPVRRAAYTKIELLQPSPRSTCISN